jgi:hypothetical protein
MEEVGVLMMGELWLSLCGSGSWILLDAVGVSIEFEFCDAAGNTDLVHNPDVANRTSWSGMGCDIWRRDLFVIMVISLWTQDLHH